MRALTPVSSLLAQLAVLAVGLTSNEIDALAAELDDIPGRAVAGVINASETDWDDPARHQLLTLLAHDRRADVRLEVAISLGFRPDLGDAGDALLAHLVVDASGAVRRVAVDDLGTRLEALAPLARTELVTRWAVDARAERRLALAKALDRTPLRLADLVGAGTALQHLQNDAVDGVRAAAHRAWMRLASSAD